LGIFFVANDSLNRACCSSTWLCCI
jgi:hypothetical protein